MKKSVITLHLQYRKNKNQTEFIMAYVKEILVVVVALVVYDMLVKKMINKTAA